MKSNYYSTFISGFSSIIEKALKETISDVHIGLLLDGIIVYETDAPLETIKNIPFFNNSFFLHDYDHGTIDSLLERSPHAAFSASIPPEITKDMTSFRIIISKENELISIPKQQLQKLEQRFEKKLKLPIDRSNPDLEVWFVERSEGHSFCGIRLTKKPSTDKYLEKGELRPELAWILNFLSVPKATDVFLDPFAGHGSIPLARTHFPCKKIIASDLNQELTKPNTNIELHNWDALHLPLEESSIDTIVTDPPWGIFEKINVEEFYPKMLTEFERVIKVGGILVILTAQKELFEKLIQENSNFQLESKYNILVSGKKSGVYKLIRIHS